MATNLLIVLSLPEAAGMQYYNQLKARFPEVRVDMVDHHTKVDPYIGAADILVTFGPMVADHVFRDATRLKWVQALGTGMDGIIDQPSLGPDVLLTNLHGIHGESMSEAAIMLMLALTRDLPRVLRSQARHAWDRFPARLMHGKTAGILGVGAIASALAPKLKALGMTVAGITSRPEREVGGFDRMAARGELEQAVRELDYLVLLTPYSAETRGIVSAKVLDAMKPSSYLVNLARGGIVDEDALLRVLQEKRIAGAALDVFGKEPLPPEHPFWALENVIVTPHLGGFHDEYPARALPVIEQNLRRFLAGDIENMTNIVKRAAWTRSA